MSVNVLDLPKHQLGFPTTMKTFLEVFCKYILPIYVDRFPEFQNIRKAHSMRFKNSKN
jgi:hypothetical protein